ncbi:spore coat protein CotH [Lewinellaceae bacterium SD302]|nr:spore coat protein CotH [Lewinellaceae bacterium SD302]
MIAMRWMMYTLCLLFSLPLLTQTDFSSQLPIMVIDTEGGEIEADDKIMARLGIVDNGVGNLNSPDDDFNDYDGWIGIEFRGSSSLSFPKKGYSLETREADGEDEDASLLGFPTEEDWVLHGPYTDKSLLRNAMLYSLAGEMMAWAPRVRMVELILNNDYQGVYLFTERIKRDEERVDIAKLREEEIDGDDLTGGYILKFDKLTGESDEVESFFFSNYAGDTPAQQDIRILYDYPAPEELVPEQRTYIREWVRDFEDRLMGDNWLDEEDGYAHLIDRQSIVDMIILNEISRNVDGFRLSTYFHKQKDSDGGQLVMGPVWDFNFAFGNANYCRGFDVTGWAMDFPYDCPEDPFQTPRWWSRFLKDREVAELLNERYFELREGILGDAAIEGRIDDFLDQMGEAPARNFERWPILGEYNWPNSFVGDTYEEEVGYLRQWILDRLAWIDNNIGDYLTETPTYPRTEDKALIFPNPSVNGELLVSFPESFPRSGMTVRILDPLGRELVRQQISFDQPFAQMSPNLSSGVYYVSVSDRHGDILQSLLWTRR